MNNRGSLFISLLSLVLFSSAAYSQRTASDLQYYVSGNAGISIMEDSTTTTSLLPGASLDIGFESDMAFAGALGARRGPWRSELELGYQQHDADTARYFGMTAPLSAVGVSGNAEVLTGLINAYYDHDIGHGLKPYLTGGAGFARIWAELSEASVGTLSGDDTVFAYQVGAGIGYAVTEQMTLDLRYRFLGSGDPEFDTVTSEFQSHNVLLGVRIHF